MMKRIFLIGGAYLAIAIGTFGHAANTSEKAYTACLDGVDLKDRYAKCGIAEAPLAGIVGAILWPLYWSWELQA